jgi:hypothetical protein
MSPRRRRRGSYAEHRLADNPRLVLAVAAMAVAMLVPPQLLGGVEGWAIGITAALALVALGATHWALRGAVPVDYRRPLLVVVLGCAAWTAVQALPLPCGVAKLLAATAAEHVLMNRELLGDPSAGACTLSFDPGATRWELAKGVAIVAAFLSAWLLAAAGHRRKVLMAVGASVVLMALVGLAHLATGAERVFGAYEPRYSMHRPVLAPLLNPNHLSGFLAMGVPVLAGLGLATRDAARRTIWMGGAALCGTTAILTLSRGGVASLVAGMLFLGVLAARRRAGRGGRRSVAGLIWVGGALVLMLAGGAYLALGPVTREFAEGDLTKLELIAQAGAFVLEHPWLGVGRGAFAAAFVQAGGLADYRAEHPENLVVQWAAEWGLPVALALIGVIAWALRRAAVELRSLERAGALAAVGSIAAHDLVDFSLELAGVAVVGAALIGAAIPSRSPRATPEAKGAPWRRSVLPVLAAGAGLLLVLSPTLARGSVRALHDDLVKELSARDRKQFAERLQHALALHPSEPVFPLLAATEAVQHGDPSAPRWLNRSMTLAPAWPSPHVVAARWLWTQGAHTQAMLEIRQAAERSPGVTRPFLCDVVRRRDDAGELIALAAPEGILRAPFLEVASTCLHPRSPAAVATDALLLEAEPAAVPPLLRQARRRMWDGEPQEAVLTLRRGLDKHRDRAEVWLALAEAEVAAGDPDAALEAVRRAEGLPGDHREILRAKARNLGALGDEDGMREALQQLRGLSGGAPEQVARALAFEGELWEASGQRAQALRAFEQAHRVAPRRDRLERVARAAQALGDRRRAFRAYLELCQTHPDVERYCQQKERVQRSMKKASPPAPGMADLPISE